MERSTLRTLAWGGGGAAGVHRWVGHRPPSGGEVGQGGQTRGAAVVVAETGAER